MARSRKPSSNERSKPKVHVTHTGGRYVNPDELLRNPEVKEAIDTMAEIAQRDQKGGAENTSNPGCESGSLRWSSCATLSR